MSRDLFNDVLHEGLHTFQTKQGIPSYIWFDSFYVPRCQHDDGYVDGRSQIKVHTNELLQRSVFIYGHPSK